MSTQDTYTSFLRAKAAQAQLLGIAFDAGEVNPRLKPHARAIVPWAVHGGRRAIFARFGLQKTSMQLEILRIFARRTGGPVLAVVPLGVRQEFARDASLYFDGLRTKFIRSPSEIESGSDVVHITNYETVRDGKLDPRLFQAASLDEASVLRGFGGTKTFREFMRLFESVPYRFVATATPDPNEFIELLAYSAFLGVMDVGEAKTRFFKRDSTKADKLTLHAHKEREFWLWVASWAIFIQRPSDLGFSDEGYDLPELDVRWHELESDASKTGVDSRGQGTIFEDAAIGVVQAAAEKRGSLSARTDKMLELRAEDPGAHRILWHDLEAERHAIERACPTAVAIWGSQDLDEREKRVIDFSEGRFAELAAKPVIAGSGCNFQRHCNWAIYLGIGFKFNDFIQSIHRLQRYGQTKRVRIDMIYTEAEREVRRSLEAKWQRYEHQAEAMGSIIREYGLAREAIEEEMRRSIGQTRAEESGERWRAINADCVEETARMDSASVALIVTSIPFSTQYEYSASYNDFGHNEDTAAFWRQMDFLTPELLRVLQPGRVAAIHVKDRIVPGGLTALGFQTVSPFHAEAIAHYIKHGFAYLGMKTIATDVVRENNQTYRLGWTEQCKDGSRMGVGMPEYLLLFRRPPTDRSNGYADVPVVKDKPLCNDHGEPAPFDPSENWKHPVPGTGYSRGRWQLDAHGFSRSSGDRLLTPEELRDLPHSTIYKLWRERSSKHVYNYEAHVRLCEDLDRDRRLPATFMLLPPHSTNADVWSDVTRMRTLNGAQWAAGKEMHICPIQFDIVNRTVTQFSMPGETVFDPFGGLMTVPLCAVKLGRYGIGIELSPNYWRDGVAYLRGADVEARTPTLFDTMEDPQDEPADIPSEAEGFIVPADMVEVE